MEKSTAFFAIAFALSTFAVLPILRPGADLIGMDHTFHIIKFELLARHGLTDYPELGGIGPDTIIPPFILLFYPVILLFGPRIAYVIFHMSLMALPVFVGRKLRMDYRPVLASIFFPVTLFIFPLFGRLLEMSANIFFLLLFFYLDDEPDMAWSSLLFGLGLTAHLPTAVLYSAPILLKVHEKKLYRHLAPWSAIFLIWAPMYLPDVLGKTGMVFSRLTFGRLRFMSVLNEIMPMVKLVAIVALLVVVILFFGLENTRHFAVPFVLGVVSAAMVLLNVGIIEHVPAINQITPFTPVAMFSVLLWQNKKRLWVLLSYAALPVIMVVYGILMANSTIDLHAFDFINGSQVAVSGCSRSEGTFDCEMESIQRLRLSNYLAAQGLPSPFCTTWEYSEPYWYFYAPGACDELDTRVDYTLLAAKNNAWAANCTGSRLVEGFYVVPT